MGQTFKQKEKKWANNNNNKIIGWLQSLDFFTVLIDI